MADFSYRVDLIDKGMINVPFLLRPLCDSHAESLDHVFGERIRPDFKNFVCYRKMNKLLIETIHVFGERIRLVMGNLEVSEL